MISGWQMLRLVVLSRVVYHWKQELLSCWGYPLHLADQWHINSFLSFSTRSYGSENHISDGVAQKLHANLGFFCLLCATQLLSFHRTSQSILHLNSVVKRQKLPDLGKQQTPSGDRKELLCGISLRRWSRGGIWLQSHCGDWGHV